VQAKTNVHEIDMEQLINTLKEMGAII
jgi:uncharacterized protein YlxW (UPF0749 family)